MRRRRRLLLLLPITMGTLPAVGSTVPTAAEGTSGGGGFALTLSLEAYPCLFVSCGGTMIGLFTGSMSGADPATCPTSPTLPAPPCRGYTIMWPDPTVPLPASNMSGSFLYNESCPIAETAMAGGSYTITGGYVDDNGTIAHDGSITGSFGYSRRGLPFTLTLTVTTVSGNGHTLGTQQFDFGVGAGAFVADDATDTCFTTIGENVTAYAVGSAVVPE
jgi:hypothetical protein